MIFVQKVIAVRVLGPNYIVTITGNVKAKRGLSEFGGKIFAIGLKVLFVQNLAVRRALGRVLEGLRAPWEVPGSVFRGS